MVSKKDKWIDRWTNRWPGGQMDRLHTYKWIDMDRQRVRQMEKWMYRRRMHRDRQMYGQKKVEKIDSWVG
jgi:hypothetical protein